MQARQTDFKHLCYSTPLASAAGCVARPLVVSGAVASCPLLCGEKKLRQSRMTYSLSMQLVASSSNYTRHLRSRTTSMWPGQLIKFLYSPENPLKVVTKNHFFFLQVSMKIATTESFNAKYCSTAS